MGVTFSAWCESLQADIALIRQAGVQPHALVLRLTEMLEGVDGFNIWRNFKSAGRGTSSQYQDVGNGYVVLTFRHRADSEKVRDRLLALAERFTAIKEISYREFGKDNACITLELAGRPRE